MEVSYQYGTQLPKWMLTSKVEVSYQYGIQLPKVEVSYQILKLTTKWMLATKGGSWLPEKKDHCQRLKLRTRS